MKISVDIDCSPEEARRLMGLPDLTPLHDAFLGKLRDMMGGTVGADTLEQLVRNWGPMTDAGLGAWRQLLTQLAGAAKG